MWIEKGQLEHADVLTFKLLISILWEELKETLLTWWCSPSQPVGERTDKPPSCLGTYRQKGLVCMVTNWFDQLCDYEWDTFEVMKAAENRKKKKQAGQHWGLWGQEHSSGHNPDKIQWGRQTDEESQKDHKAIDISWQNRGDTATNGA